MQSAQQKISLEARVFESLNQYFPEFKCSITDIKFPKSEFVINFYTFVLEELSFDVAKIMQGPLENQLQGECHPELYVKTLQMVNLSRALGAILNRLLYADKVQFGLDDLLEPTAARNSLFMFNLLNFCSFADVRMVELASKLEVIGQRKGDVVKLLEKREMLSRAINQRAATKAKRADYAKEVKSKKAEIEELSKESKSIEQFCEKKVAELEGAKNKLGRVESEVAQLKATYQKLEAEEVQSPVALESNLKNMQAKLEESKQQLAEGRQTLEQKIKATALFEVVERGIDIRLGLATEIVSGAKTVKELEKQLEDVQIKQKSEIEETRRCQAKLTDLKKEYSDLSHQFTANQLQWENRKKSMEEEIRFCEREKTSLESKESEEMEKVRKAILEVQEEVNTLIEKNQAFNKYCIKKYEELMEKEQQFVAMKQGDVEAIAAELEDLKKHRSKGNL